MCLILVPLLPATAQEKVLFIGNSFTYSLGDGNAEAVGGVPAIFDALARAGDQGDPEVTRRAVGGRDFEFHATNGTSQNFITQDAWDFVVIQNHSSEPTHLVDSFRSVEDHLTFGNMLAGQVFAHRPDAKVIFFETFARGEGHPIITGTSTVTSFVDSAQMQAEVRENYAGLVALANASHPESAPILLAPVGSAWENAGGLLPVDAEGFVNLHSADRLHGNDNGYYLAAAVMYATIYGRSPEGLASSAEVGALNLQLTANMAELERAAWETVEELEVTVPPDPDPVDPPVISRVSADLQNRTLQIDWSSVAEQSYLVEASEDLETWTALVGSLPSGGDVTSLVVPWGEAETRYFRVRVETE